MTSKGSCHCGRIVFEVEGEPGDVLECTLALSAN